MWTAVMADVSAARSWSAQPGRRWVVQRPERLLIDPSSSVGVRLRVRGSGGAAGALGESGLFDGAVVFDAEGGDDFVDGGGGAGF